VILGSSTAAPLKCGVSNIWGYQNIRRIFRGQKTAIASARSAVSDPLFVDFGCDPEGRVALRLCVHHRRVVGFAILSVDLRAVCGQNRAVSGGRLVFDRQPDGRAGSAGVAVRPCGIGVGRSHKGRTSDQPLRAAPARLCRGILTFSAPGGQERRSDAWQAGRGRAGCRASRLSCRIIAAAIGFPRSDQLSHCSGA
jgi:hypothetical protein